MLRGGLFAVSGDETDGQLEGPFLCVPVWTLVNYLGRGSVSAEQQQDLCLCFPRLLSSHVHAGARTDELPLTRASCVLKVIKHTWRQGMFVFLLNS